MLDLVPAATQSVLFDIVGDAEAGLLPRILVPFARRDLALDQMKARRHGDVVHICVAMDAMPAEMLHLVEGNLRQIVGVRRVEVVLRGVERRAA